MALQTYVGVLTIGLGVSGDVTVSPEGLDFVPTAIQFLGVSSGFGASIVTAHRAAAMESQDNLATSNVVTATYNNQAYAHAVSGGVDATFTVSSFNSSPNGFTININNAFGVGHDVIYILYGGDVTGGEFTTIDVGTVDGDVVVNFASAPSVVFLWQVMASATFPSAPASNINASNALGWVCPDGTQAYALSRHTDAQAAAVTSRSQRTDRALVLHSDTTTFADLSLVSLSGTTLTLHQNGTPGVANTKIIAMALFGGKFTVVDVTGNTTTDNFDVNTPGVDPSFVFMQTIGNPETTSVVTTAKRSVGVAASAGGFGVANFDEHNADPTNVARTQFQDGTIAVYDDTGSSLQDKFGVASFGAQKVVVSHPVASGNGYHVIMLVGGETARLTPPFLPRRPMAHMLIR